MERQYSARTLEARAIGISDKLVQVLIEEYLQATAMDIESSLAQRSFESYRPIWIGYHPHL